MSGCSVPSVGGSFRCREGGRERRREACVCCVFCAVRGGVCEVVCAFVYVCVSVAADDGGDFDRRGRGSCLVSVAASGRFGPLPSLWAWGWRGVRAGLWLDGEAGKR